ncbi:MAG: dihydrolipoyl dehydrogenase [Pseudomonadota bacterium]
MSNNLFDLIVIGAGPAGYVCAIRASQLGMKVACVDKNPDLGGTCLNVGCIPSKALLHSSFLYHQTKDLLASHGIRAEKLSFDLKTFMARKDKVVQDLTRGVGFLFKKHEVTAFTGEAYITSPQTVEVKKARGRKETLQAKSIVVATGSMPVVLPDLEVDEKQVVTSTGALSLSKVPEHLMIVGGGYIGLEIGSVWRRLGAKVTVIEMLETLVPLMDQELAQVLYRHLLKQGVEFKLGAKVESVRRRKDQRLTVRVKTLKNGAPQPHTCDVLMVAAGRKPLTQGLGLEEIGVAYEQGGQIQVDSQYATSVPGIYAIGDVIAGPMLAHKGEEEGIALAELLAGQQGHVNYAAIPSVVYTHPEVASVGQTEEQLKEQGIAYKKGRFPFSANPRAKAVGDTEGFVKILSHAGHDQILGVHIIAPDAGSLIAEAVVAMEFGATAEDLARTCHAHPSLNEAVKEAALDACGRVLHR